MSDIAALLRRRGEIQQQLERAESGSGGATDAAALREAIKALFQETERWMSELSELRDSIRPLAERYHAVFGAASAAVAHDPNRAGSPPAEHLDATTHLDRAWNAIATCSYEEAIDAVGRALELAPGDVQGRILLGWALMRLGRLSEARVVLEGVLVEEPRCALAHASLGYVALREGAFAEAVDHLSQAARSGDDRKASLYANLYLGMVYTARGMYRDGRSFLARALELGPNLVEAYWEMGRSYYLEGQFSLALDSWRRGAEINRYDPWGERCTEAVERATAGGAVPLE